MLPWVSIPRYGWGDVTHASVGTVTAVDDGTITVDFTDQSDWTAAVGELQVVSPGTEGVCVSYICVSYTEAEIYGRHTSVCLLLRHTSVPRLTLLCVS